MDRNSVEYSVDYSTVSAEEKPQPVFFAYLHILGMPVCICERKRIERRHLRASPKISYLHQ